jgi:hypothetical protein
MHKVFFLFQAHLRDEEKKYVIICYFELKTQEP